MSEVDYLYLWFDMFAKPIKDKSIRLFLNDF